MFKIIALLPFLLSATLTAQAEDATPTIVETSKPEHPETTYSLSPYTANYEATWKAGWFPITIDATRTLEKVDNNWKISFEAYSSVADLSEISTFEQQGNKVLPINYRYKTSGFLSKKLRTLEFNRQEGKAWLPYKDIWGNYELTEETQDHLSYQEQIRLDLMAGKTKFSYPVAYKARLKNYQFEVVGETQLKTALGRLNVVEVRQTGLKKKESNHIWLAKDFEYLIVRLKATKSNGTSNTIKLKHAQFGQKAVTDL